MTFISVISLKQNSPTKSSSTKNTVLLSDCISIKQLYRIKNERKHAYIRITIPEKVLKKVGWRQGDVINFLKKENEETYVFEYITNPKLITDGLILRSYNKTGSLYTEYRLLDNDFFTIAPLENKSIVKYITFENLTIDNGKIIFSLKNAIEQIKEYDNSFNEIELTLPLGKNNELKIIQNKNQMKIDF